MFPSTATGLPKDWVYSPSIDLELKQYVLLGYLQRVKGQFAARKLYPYLEQVHEHVADLLSLQRNKELWTSRLGGDMVAFDLSTGTIVRERPSESDLMRVIDEVVDFAIPGLVDAHEEGITLRDELERHIHTKPVGVLPMHTAEGWLLLRAGKEARIYTYALTLVQETRADRLHRNIVTRFVRNSTVGLSYSYEHIKQDLIRAFPDQPNPATFVAESEVEMPCMETFMPLVKRHLHAFVQAPYR